MIATQTTDQIGGTWSAYNGPYVTGQTWTPRANEPVVVYRYVGQPAEDETSRAIEELRQAVLRHRDQCERWQALQAAGPVRRGAPRQATRGLRRWVVVRVPTLHCMRAA